jgi:hypothetical protein
MKHRRRQRRNAAVLVVVLVCLLVALSIATTMIAETLTRRAQLPIETNARQVELLVQAGRGRAAARLAADADYSGEQWTPTVGATEAIVDIATETSEDGATRVTVVATYPDDALRAVRRSRVFLFRKANLTAEE